MQTTAEPHTAARGGTNAEAAEIGKFDAIAGRFWDEHGPFRPLHLLNPVRMRFITERCATAGARALDVGCGGGLVSEALARAGASVCGIDLAAGMIDVAALHGAAHGLSIEYRVASAETLAAEQPGAFDIVTCMEMLEHVPDPRAMLGTLAQLVRPGGSLFASTLNRNLKSFLVAIVGAEYLLSVVPRGTHEYERFIRPSELIRWARPFGLEARALTGVTLSPLGSARLSADPSVNYIAQLVRTA
ncbi:MAG: bifunctional 2-polyprenyl-6-hydroxyphenol methylase/3-demethylubiquinol 3-O-methyltransferase UbiG [Pseudomonadota bacterium]|jgi:2-polyprenyl-6-hydroxyphenyl methylase/3-demethylubiquinone-9 3-methyltransferase|nr:bifunctional 2-polyprenyl-6-hydroxyphenol methylase/3-demethylubiquinol 3-O-methyltransferase UbiG [Pseudomonadota bacterium]